MPRQVWTQVLRPHAGRRAGPGAFLRHTARHRQPALRRVAAGRRRHAGAVVALPAFRHPKPATCRRRGSWRRPAGAWTRPNTYRNLNAPLRPPCAGPITRPLLDAEREGRIRPLPHAQGFHYALRGIWAWMTLRPSGFLSGALRLLAHRGYYEASGEGLAHYAQVLAAKARPAGAADSSIPEESSLAGRGFVYGTHIARDIRVRELVRA